jgi:hypothetical protein
MSSPRKRDDVPEELTSSRALEFLFGKAWSGVRRAFSRATLVTGLGGIGLGTVLLFHPPLAAVGISFLALGVGTTAARVGALVEKRLRVVQKRWELEASSLKALAPSPDHGAANTYEVRQLKASEDEEESAASSGRDAKESNEDEKSVRQA